MRIFGWILKVFFSYFYLYINLILFQEMGIIKPNFAQHCNYVRLVRRCQMILPQQIIASNVKICAIKIARFLFRLTRPPKEKKDNLNRILFAEVASRNTTYTMILKSMFLLSSIQQLRGVLIPLPSMHSKSPCVL